MLKKIFSHTLIYGLGEQVPKIAALLSLPIIRLFAIAAIIEIFTKPPNAFLLTKKKGAKAPF